MVYTMGYIQKTQHNIMEEVNEMVYTMGTYKDTTQHNGGGELNGIYKGVYTKDTTQQSGGGKSNSTDVIMQHNKYFAIQSNAVGQANILSVLPTGPCCHSWMKTFYCNASLSNHLIFPYLCHCFIQAFTIYAQGNNNVINREGKSPWYYLTLFWLGG